MKIQLLSDLHLEANPDFVPEPAPGADVLVLAGDVGSYQRRTDGSRMGLPDWGLRAFSPLARYAAWPVPVLFVPGNHEYDGLDFDAGWHQLRHTCERLGMVWLDREVVELSGVRFVGTTLWSDYDALLQPGMDAQQRDKQRQKAYKAANFYLNKMGTWRGGQAFDAAAMREEALRSQAWLGQALDRPFDGRTVVVTHFAPSLHSADPRYGLTPGTAGFCNNLDRWLDRADLWLHGHLHCAHDYTVGRCRVVANPLGYAAKHEQDRFQPACTIQLD